MHGDLGSGVVGCCSMNFSNLYLVSRNKFEGMLHVLGVFPIDDVNSTDEVFRTKFEITAAAADAEGTSGLAVDLADDDHAVEEEDVALSKPSSVLDQHVEFSL